MNLNKLISNKNHSSVSSCGTNSAMIPGMMVQERIDHETSKSLSKKYHSRISSRGGNSALISGMMISSMPSLEPIFITREEYDEHGPEFIHIKSRYYSISTFGDFKKEETYKWTRMNTQIVSECAARIIRVRPCEVFQNIYDFLYSSKKNFFTDVGFLH